MKKIVLILFAASRLSGCSELEQKEIIDLSNPYQKVQEAYDYCLTHDMSTDLAIIIDMGIHSGRKRFNVWDLNKRKLIKSYLVSHGCGKNTWSGDYSKENPEFSNIENSHCSSLGKYRVGERGWSSFGVHINYRLHGLEESSSNANKRNIVFHSWAMVSDEEVYPNGTPEGWGCPAVSNNAFLEIDQMLRNSSKPVLLYIYCS